MKTETNNTIDELGLPDLTKQRELDKQSLCTLTVTQPNVRSLIQNQIAHPIWRYLAKHYSQTDELDTIQRAKLDVLNSIVFQRRAFFNLSRRDLQMLTRNSDNWAKKTAFRDEAYSKIRGDLIRDGYIQPLGQPISRCSQAFQVINPVYLSAIGSVDHDKQREECVAFSLGLNRRNSVTNDREPVTGTSHGNQGTKESRNEVPRIPRDYTRASEPLKKWLATKPDYVDKVKSMERLLLEPDRRAFTNGMLSRAFNDNLTQDVFAEKEESARLIGAAILLFRTIDVVPPGIDPDATEEVKARIKEIFGNQSA